MFFFQFFGDDYTSMLGVYTDVLFVEDRPMSLALSESLSQRRYCTKSLDIVSSFLHICYILMG